MKSLILFTVGLSLCLSAYIPTGYYQVPNAQGDSNSTIQGALNTGVTKILSDLVKGNYIPNTNFVVSQVNSYAQQNKSTTTTNFAFDVVLSNNVDTTISTTFIVSRALRTGVNTVTSYSVQISKVTPVQPNFVDVSPQEIASNPLITTLRDYGFQAVVSQVLVKYPFVSGPFTVTKTNSVQRQTLSDGRVIYKFNAEGYNPDNARLVAAYALSYKPTTDEKTMLNSTYVLVEGDKVDDLGQLGSGSYSQVSQAEADSALVKGIRDFGIQQLVADGVQKDKLPNNVFVVSKTNGVYKQVSSGSTNYKFDLVLVDNKGTTIAAIFIVTYTTQTQGKEMVGFVYSCQKAS